MQRAVSTDNEGCYFSSLTQDSSKAKDLHDLALFLTPCELLAINIFQSPPLHSYWSNLQTYKIKRSSKPFFPRCLFFYSMDWNVSLDDIIKSKQRSAPSRGRRLDGRRLYDPLYSSPRLSLSTSQLPNRLDQQRRRRRRREPSDDNYQGGDDLLVTRPAWGHVNPASIVITTKVSPSPSKKSEDRRPETKNVAPPAPFDKELSSSPLSAEQHQNDTSDLQQRVNDQNEHIVELQRLLNEPLPPLSFLADHPASCVVLFTNLDPAATSSGIRVRNKTSFMYLFFMKLIHVSVV